MRMQPSALPTIPEQTELCCLALVSFEAQPSDTHIAEQLLYSPSSSTTAKSKTKFIPNPEQVPRTLDQALKPVLDHITLLTSKFELALSSISLLQKTVEQHQTRINLLEHSVHLPTVLQPYQQPAFFLRQQPKYTVPYIQQSSPDQGLTLICIDATIIQNPRILVDTGSQICFVTKSIAARSGWKLHNCREQTVAFGGHNSFILHYVIIPITFFQGTAQELNIFDMMFYIAPDCDVFQVLLGVPFITHSNIHALTDVSLGQLILRPGLCMSTDPKIRKCIPQPSPDQVNWVPSGVNDKTRWIMNLHVISDYVSAPTT
jgi:hypothetical protein